MWAIPRVWWDIVLDDLAATALPLRQAEITGTHGLPAIHQDPFDWALIAQAAAEDLTLVTTDKKILLYASERLRMIR
jgi:PIN domain nuclease of toxin-antitoxin system